MTNYTVRGIPYPDPSIDLVGQVGTVHLRDMAEKADLLLGQERATAAQEVTAAEQNANTYAATRAGAVQDQAWSWDQATLNAAKSHADTADQGVLALVNTRLESVSTAYDVWLALGNEGTMQDYLEAQKVQGPEGPYGGTAVTDPQVASFLASGMATRTAVEDAVAPIVGVIDSRYPSLEAALAACAPGATLEVREAWARTAPWVIDKPVTVVFRGGSLTATGIHTTLIEVTSDGVTLDAPVVTGAGAVYATGSGITVRRTATDPVRGFTMRGAVVRDIPMHGVMLEHVTGPVLTDCTVENVGYSGFMMLSVLDSSFTACHVRNITQPAPWVNSYGFALTRHESKTIQESPRTKGATLTGCTVTDHPKWEAFDTHGGESITFLGCIARNALIGFAMVPCPNQDKSADIYAPLDVKIIGCTVIGDPNNANRQAGIKVIGCGLAGVPGERATGVVYGNTVVDMGGSDVNRAGGIQVSCVSGVEVAANQIIRPQIAGIYAYHSNDQVTLRENTITDVWSNTLSFAAAVYSRSQDNKLTLQGNRMRAGGHASTVINQDGVYVASTTGVRMLDMGGGDTTIAATPWRGSTAVRQVAFYGAAPVAKPVVSGAKSGNAAVTSLVTALAQLGLITNSTT